MSGRSSRSRSRCGLTVEPPEEVLVRVTLRKNALQVRQEKPSLCLIQEVSWPHTRHTWANLTSPAGTEILET